MAPFSVRRADNPEPLQPDAPLLSRIEPEIQELASRLAEQGIQSTELVLDLVLHDLAEEARQAVGATGAAIALEREGELVCRAAAGATAPDLGVRIHKEAGLSGTCVKQRASQICSDTELDGRVDAEACRRLGVRSILVVPLFSADEIIGIFEIFSARTNAFSADQAGKLESLASIAAQTIKAAREKMVQPPDTATTGRVGVGSTEPTELSVVSIMQKVTPVDPAVKVLRWLVIGFAIPLIVLIGFDWGWHRAQPPATSGSVPHNESPAEPEPRVESSPVSEPTASAPGPQKVSPTRPNPAGDLVSRGGLVIYQSGKVIYREEPTAVEKKLAPVAQQTGSTSLEAASPAAELEVPPANKTSEPPPAPSAISLPPGVTGGTLVHSVHPKYPAKAIVQKLEGPVVLHGTVGQDGIIRDLKLVSGDPLLSQAALEAVQQWKYEPYRRNGTPISMPIDITIDFNLPK